MMYSNNMLVARVGFRRSLLLYVLIMVCLGTCSNIAFGQATGAIQGRVYELSTQKPVVGASVLIASLSKGTYTDSTGRYLLSGIPLGTYTIETSYLGFATQIEYEVRVDRGIATLDFGLQEEDVQAGEVTVTSSSFTKSPLNLVSFKSIGQEQIRSNPGGNFDISKVLQSLPGVSGAVGFRNDIIVRGGAPNENVFYLDGIETPIINHFATQGSGGGPFGIVNALLVQNITFQAGGFGAQYDNTLSSVFDFQLVPGNSERLQTRAIISASEAGLTLDGPLNKKGNLTGLVSVRRSYLQLLFKAIGLPFLPSFWDGTAKLQWQVNDKTTLCYVAIGAIDRLEKNQLDDPTLEQLALFEDLPISELNTWTHGFTAKRLTPRGYYTLALSQNVLENKSFLNRNEDPNQNVLTYTSQDGEYRFRANAVSQLGTWRVSYGGVVIRNYFNNFTFNLVGTDDTNRVSNSGRFWRYGAFGSVSKSYLNDRLKTTFGVRTDLNSLTDEGDDPLRTISPRASFSYAISNRVNLNGSIGTYFKLPPITILGWGENGVLPNQDSRYWRSDQFVLGLDFSPEPSSIISLEGFLKLYDGYSVSETDGISLANTGGDFGVFGNERVLAVGRGRAYGAELYGQKKLTNRLYGIASYTLFWSEFTGADREDFVRSSWDNRNLLSLTGGWIIGSKKQWELAAKWRYLGGAPYTPYRLDAEAADFYAERGSALVDYNRLNDDKTIPFSQIDVRVERKWIFEKWNLSLFLDIQNVLNRENLTRPSYTLARNPDNSFQTPYQPVVLNNVQTALLPSVGFIARL